MGDMITPEQCRAARGWLNWTQAYLADWAGVSLSTVRNFESGRRAPIRNNLEALAEAFEVNGIRLTFDGEVPTGIVAHRGNSFRQPACFALVGVAAHALAPGADLVALVATRLLCLPGRQLRHALPVKRLVGGDAISATVFLH